MDYEQRYKQAIEKIRKGLQPLSDGAKISGVTRAFLEEVFPELGESESEKIRKELIQLISCMHDKDPRKKDWLSWLEKQGQEPKKVSIWKHWKNGIAGNGEDKPIYLIKTGYTYSLSSCLSFECDYIELSELDNLLIEKQGEKKATDKGEPKFKVGDWIITKDKNVHKDYSICKIVEIENNRYHLENGDYLDIDTLEQYGYYLWTIDDAKDGDVLVDVYGNIGIFQKNDDFDWSSYCSLGPNGGFRCFAIEHELDGSHPATKEQRDLLFKKIEEAGYQWDAKKKELKLLISNGGDFESNNSKQKPTWSDQDDAYELFAISAVEDYYDEKNPLQKCLVDWLKSLKERLL